MSAGKELLKGIWKENPVLVLFLGMCPSLATSSSAKNGLGMGLATAFVLCCSNMAISVLTTHFATYPTAPNSLTPIRRLS